MRTGVRWAVLVGVFALSAGVLVGALVLPPLPPPSATSLASTRTVPVVARAFDDAHTVSATPALTTEVTVLTSGAGGIVTASSCSPGGEVKTGDHLFSVDGVVRIAVVTGVPLWRDVVLGTKGPDVEAIQATLAALGYPVTVSGAYDRVTAAAVVQLQKTASVPASGQVLLAQVQWVPANVGAVSSCEAGVGSAVSQGQPLLKAGGGLAGLSLPAPTSELPGRAYVAVAGDTVVPILEDRRLTDPGLLTVVASSPAFTEWTRDPSKGVAVDVRLAEPVGTVGVPPSAVVLADGDRGCVVAADGDVVPVQVIASELGTVFVVPERAVEEVTIPAAQVVSACG